MKGRRTGRGEAVGYAALAAACLGAGAAWTANAWGRGQGFSPDSNAYQVSALVIARGAPLPLSARRPPLFAACLALAMKATGFPAEAASLVNGIALTGGLLAALCLLRRARVPWYAAAAVALGLWLSPASLHVRRMVWSETLYAGLVLGHAALAARYFDEHDGRALAGAAALAAAAALTRYVGYSVLLVFSMAVLVSVAFGRGRDAFRGRRVVAAAAALAAAAAPSLLWVGRNVAGPGGAHGPRAAARAGIGDAVGRVVTHLGFAGGRAWVLLGLVAGVVWAVRAVRGRRIDWASAYPGLLSLACLGLLLAAASRIAMDPIDLRLLAPVLPPWMVFAAVVLSGSPRGSPRAGRVRRVAASAALVAAAAAGTLRPGRGLAAEALGAWPAAASPFEAGACRGEAVRAWRGFLAGEMERGERILCLPGLRAGDWRGDRYLGVAVFYRRAAWAGVRPRPHGIAGVGGPDPYHPRFEVRVGPGGAVWLVHGDPVPLDDADRLADAARRRMDASRARRGWLLFRVGEVLPGGWPEAFAAVGMAPTKRLVIGPYALQGFGPARAGAGIVEPGGLP